MILSLDGNARLATPWVHTPRVNKDQILFRFGLNIGVDKKQHSTQGIATDIQTYNVMNKISKAKWVDDEGEIIPSESTKSNAKIFISDFYRSLMKSKLHWREPLTNASPSEEILFEWWNEHKKLTIYCTQNSLEFIKVWGANIESEMLDGEISEDNISELANWLWK